MHVCKCVRSMLMKCGYDNVLSIKELNDERIKEMEIHLGKNRNFLEDLPKCHLSNYKSQLSFEFLPAHRLSIFKLAQGLISSEAMGNQEFFPLNNPGLHTPLLKELIEQASKNSDKVPAARRYSKLLIDFAMHNYMINGRLAYEILSANLPIPKVSTIRMFKQTLFIF